MVNSKVAIPTKAPVTVYILKLNIWYSPLLLCVLISSHHIIKVACSMKLSKISPNIDERRV
jgi:hypothetical protein